MYAFRCRNCNSLEEAGHAGENAVPRRCRICGAGGAFDPATGLFVPDPSNWIVLADLPQDELQPILDHHAIGADEVVAHEPFATTWTVTGQRPDVVTHECSVCALSPALTHQEGQAEPSLPGAGRHHCLVCSANRPGTTTHAQGKTETVMVPVYESAQTPLGGATPPVRTPQVIEVTADDGAGHEDVSL